MLPYIIAGATGLLGAGLLLKKGAKIEAQRSIVFNISGDTAVLLAAMGLIALAVVAKDD